MSFLGIDLGTTGCKAVLFNAVGKALSSAYREYEIIHDAPGHAELDALQVWNHVKNLIRECVADSPDKVEAISVSSLGEAIVPVSQNRLPLGNSLLNFDNRGSDLIPELHEIISDEELYTINGNPLAPNYGLTKLYWYKKNQPSLYAETYKFLLWGSYILYMLGAEPVVDYALANRTLLLDIGKEEWNVSLLGKLGFSKEKLPELAEAGTVCGKMLPELVDELGFLSSPLLVVGTHDQCANALGCGVLEQGTAMYGMGTFHCIVSVSKERGDSSEMLSRGLNTEHHAVPGQWVSFIYNQGGILLKWFRDTFALGVKEFSAVNIYEHLMHEMPEGPSPVSVLPHFTTTGPPDFIEKTAGNISGLTIDTTRGDVCKGLLEGIAFYLKENLDNLPPGMDIAEFRVVGGGSKSDIWMQLTADILERPCMRTVEAEAGALGAAMLAACGSGKYNTIQEAAAAMVVTGRKFLPDKSRSESYYSNYKRYKELYPRFGSFLAEYKD
jgi:xylulokinase